MYWKTSAAEDHPNGDFPSFFEDWETEEESLTAILSTQTKAL